MTEPKHLCCELNPGQVEIMFQNVLFQERF